jgi:hypothetical protein
MRRLAALLIAGTLSLPLAVPASAVAPVIVRYGFTVTERVGPATCGFPVLLVVRGKGQSFLFMDRDGNITRGKATGPITATFTNLRTDRSVRYAISGPSFYDADGDLVRGTGRWYVFTADGRPAIAVGNLTFDDAGAPTNARHTIDVCDALS